MCLRMRFIVYVLARLGHTWVNAQGIPHPRPQNPACLLTARLTRLAMRHCRNCCRAAVFATSARATSSKLICPAVAAAANLPPTCPAAAAAAGTSLAPLLLLLLPLLLLFRGIAVPLVQGGADAGGPEGMLEVHLVRTAALRSEDLLGHSDPYVILRVSRGD